MYSFFLRAHSGLRYLVLALIVIALLSAIIAVFRKKTFSPLHKKIALFSLITSHLQLLLGLGLYFLSPLVALAQMSRTMKTPTLRYWTVEHVFMMVIAIVLVTVGYSRAKKGATDVAKHKAIILFFGLALLLIVVAILQSTRGLL